MRGTPSPLWGEVGVRGLCLSQFSIPHPAHFVRRPLPMGEVDLACGPVASNSALELRSGDALQIAVPDLLLIGLRHVDALDDAQRLARIHRALFRIEWA